jgi:hypothetical protein
MESRDCRRHDDSVMFQSFMKVIFGRHRCNTLFACSNTSVVS